MFISQTWYLLGTICVVAAFPIFFPAIGLDLKKWEPQSNLFNSTTDKSLENTTIYPSLEFEGEEEQALTAYYTVFFMLFSFGSATIRTSLLSMIPVIACNENDRMDLTAVRKGATALTNILFYSITWILFDTGKFTKKYIT